MAFRLNDAKAIAEQVQTGTWKGTISRTELVGLLREKTGTMQAWWLRSYLQQLTAAGLFKLNEDGSFSVTWHAD